MAVSRGRERPAWMLESTEYQLHWRVAKRGPATTELQAIECCECGERGLHIEHIDHAAGCSNVR